MSPAQFPAPPAAPRLRWSGEMLQEDAGKDSGPWKCICLAGVPPSAPQQLEVLMRSHLLGFNRAFCPQHCCSAPPPSPLSLPLPCQDSLGSAGTGQSSQHSSHQEPFSHCEKTESTKRNQFVRKLVMSCCRELSQVLMTSRVN